MFWKNWKKPIDNQIFRLIQQFCLRESCRIISLALLLPFGSAFCEGPVRKTKITPLDERMLQFIRNRDFPGAVLLVLKDGKPVISKSWGETWYNSGQRPGPGTTLYDLASVTKAVAIGITLMHMVEQGRVSENDTLGKYVKAARGYPLGKLSIERLLAHKTGLPPYYFSNYWLLSTNKWNESSFPAIAGPENQDPFRGKYLPSGYRQGMLRDLCRLPFTGRMKTIYSDLNYILLGCLVEEVSGKRLDEYLNDWLFRPMGLKNITFNPLVNGFTKKQIAPTLDDPLYHGWVNDAEAAKLAGICGAAGLFSNAGDLAEIGLMLQSEGLYKGKRFLKPATIRKFAWQIQPGHARAMGWQKPARSRNIKSIAPSKASQNSFGHTGYTGTLFWVDPTKDLVIVFLTNVTYPKDGISTFKKYAGYKTVLKLVYDRI
jgi:CubicO group peptidase (beta-lactamase class C family)